jgi:hypothetical protein
MWKPLKLTEDDAHQTADDKTKDFSIAVEEWRSRVQGKAIEQHLGKVNVHGISVGAFGAMCGKRGCGGVAEQGAAQGDQAAFKRDMVACRV